MSTSLPLEEDHQKMFLTQKVIYSDSKPSSSLTKSLTHCEKEEANVLES